VLYTRGDYMKVNLKTWKYVNLEELDLDGRK